MAGVNIIDLQKNMTYSSVVSYDAVCIGLLMAAMNRLYILSEGIQNTLLES